MPNSPDFRMFIDDTGNVHAKANNHPQNRFAGIVGVILDMEYLRETFEPSFLALKERHFGVLETGRPPVLHLRRMKKAEGPFACLENAEEREAWERACYSMYQRAQYHVITVCVDKVAFYNQYANWRGSFYELLVGNAIERYFYFLRGRGGTGDVMAEATNSALDEQLRNMYRRFYNDRTEHIPGRSLRATLSSREIKIKSKRSDVQGLQFADLLASTCFSHCKRIYANGPDYNPFAMRVADLIERQKFYRDRNGNSHGYGRVWRP
jgi:hypothetical protein